MSTIFEQLMEEQERIEREQEAQVMNKIEQCITYEKLDQILLQKEAMRINDMHDFIYSNPTLKGNLKDLTFARYKEIYKTNHASDLNKLFDHDNDQNTELVSLNEIIDNYV